MYNDKLFEGDILGFAPAIAATMEFVDKTLHSIFYNEENYSSIFNRPVNF